MFFFIYFFFTTRILHRVCYCIEQSILYIIINRWMSSALLCLLPRLPVCCSAVIINFRIHIVKYFPTENVLPHNICSWVERESKREKGKKDCLASCRVCLRTDNRRLHKCFLNHISSLFHMIIMWTLAVTREYNCSTQIYQESADYCFRKLLAASTMMTMMTMILKQNVRQITIVCKYLFVCQGEGGAENCSWQMEWNVVNRKILQP